MNRLRHLFLFLFINLLTLAVDAGHSCYAQTKRDSISKMISDVNDYDKTQIITTLEYLEENFSELENKLDQQFIAWIHEEMANWYYDLGDLENTQTNATEGLKIVIKLEDDWSKNARVRFKCLLGIVLKAQGFDEESKTLYQNALYESKSPSDSIYILNNLANLYSEINLPEKAVETYSSALEIIYRIEASSYEKGNILDNLGNVKSKINDTSALRFLYNGLKYRRHLNNADKTFSSYRHLTEHFLREDQQDSALKYAKLALNISNAIPDRSYKKEALSLLLELNPSDYGIAYKTLSDSIAEQERETQKDYTYFRFKIAEAENESLEARRALIEKGFQNSIVYYVLICALIISVMVVVLYIEKIKKKKRLAVTQAEERIAADIHDNISNDVYRLMNRVNVEDLEKKEVLDALEIVYEKTRDISKSIGMIDFSEGIPSSITRLFNEYKEGDTQVVTKNLSQVDWTNFPRQKAEALYRVLAELLNNTRKYAEATFIVISFSQDAKQVKINYKDNGIGAIIETVSGLGHAENRIAALGGSFTFESSPKNGFNAQIHL
ncbi:tetratricopeptide repeat-containing sensor histidine kinase [Gilvibacter sediminis]|uniref:tetratricopeptide repeat-containing sensor histidine kinase n=1 Tax=Gilvibacter sediminis TaxID=379071 RepID=UPI00234FCBBD|nr:tetratricopeptide repeat-containing sensor histidine kinase [Gilvibacter sediminis]MDC7997040.1 hypothetical protein [Gilvibacter sediminis]